MNFSKDFIHFAHGTRPQPAQKETRSADPSAAFVAKVDELRTTLAMAAGQADQAKTKQAAIAEAKIRFKDIGDMEGREALQILLAMSAAERKQVLDQLAQIEKLAKDWGMIPADLIELVK